eukprot:9327766-Pyramimonas_sp.AAC.1
MAASGSSGHGHSRENRATLRAGRRAKEELYPYRAPIAEGERIYPQKSTPPPAERLGSPGDPAPTW